MKRIDKIWSGLMIVGLITGMKFSCDAQTVISEQQAVDLILKNHPKLKASELTVKQSKSIQKTSINLPNPELIAESPTGDFMTVGVLQSIDFPTVYIAQNKLNKARTSLLQTEQTININDVKLEAKTLYLNIQYAKAMLEQLKRMDSLYKQISTVADKQYKAGEIDFMALTYSGSQYGEIHNRYLTAVSNYKIYRSQFRILSGVKDSLVTEALVKSLLPVPMESADTTFFKANPVIQYYQQATLVNKQLWKVEKNRALPGLVGGYLNQGPVSTPNNLRIRAGITIPLWFWQYAGSIKAAKYGYEASLQTLSAEQQAILIQQQAVQQRVITGLASIGYYETTGNKQASDLLNTAKRFFEAGKTDYINYLRTINDANEITRNYLLALKSYNEAIIQYYYLNGTL